MSASESLRFMVLAKPKNNGVAGREYNDGVVRSRLFEAGKYFFITGKDTLQRYGDGNPFGPGRQQRTDNLLMPYAAGEELPLRICVRASGGKKGERLSSIPMIIICVSFNE